MNEFKVQKKTQQPTKAKLNPSSTTLNLINRRCHYLIENMNLKGWWSYVWD